MTRLPKNRDTHLTKTELAAEGLRQFDSGKDPSIRSLAAALKVTPTAIYHHFDSRSAIIDAALQLVWTEAAEEGVTLIKGKLGDPIEILVMAALATRRAFGLRHHGLAPHIAATADSTAQLTANLGLLVGAFEALGLTDEEAGRAFHAYGTFAIGSTLVVAARLNSAEERKRPPQSRTDAGDTHGALAGMMDLSYSNPKRDEELFVDGLRRLIASFAKTD